MNIDIFNEYREITLEIINSIKNDKEDISLFEKRDNAIKKILALDLDKSEIKKIYSKEKLDVLDKELENILKEKMLSVKEEIQEIAVKKQANLGYANVNRGSNFFSKRV
ncbi:MULTISPECIES: flagellar protein FliT [Clostridium]|uniref:Flagellar protein FliT n=1 Tax=Clostridium aquiflavi TaxID=3073603 RepID=A0ABU1EDS6_9CLOT|nr:MULTISPECIES: flagellar protein FliT [unclassified Clostridium]MDR5586534.1 flagellar protein FliT [Clostridium sp. 5N-1]NFG60648.1 flagellar protein FliT [Clostridium botulinum]NFQ10566.1 flagellar protein FliT [Clostridium botulinum]